MIVEILNTKDKASVYKDVFTGLYTSTLLGGEFSNCHGKGSNIDECIISLKIRLHQLRVSNKKMPFIARNWKKK